MDRHFVDTNPRHNLPIVLALLDLWNDEFLQSKGRVVSPYMMALGSYPGLVASIENKVASGSQTTSTTKQHCHRGRKEGPTPNQCCIFFARWQSLHDRIHNDNANIR